MLYSGNAGISYCEPCTGLVKISAVLTLDLSKQNGVSLQTSGCRSWCKQSRVHFKNVQIAFEHGCLYI